jgi:hypothetical protein
MTDMYAPNQQVVREDGSGPAEEGTGGEPAAEPAAESTRKPAAKPAAKRGKGSGSDDGDEG